MHYEGIIIRPPAKASSLLLQVTVGCSHNKCTFCGTYRTKKFKIKLMDIIKSDLEEASSCILLSVTVILGVGGKEKSIEHAMDTAALLTDIDPDYAGALTLMLVPGTPLYGDYMAGKFALPDTFGFIRELYLIIANSNFTNCYFTSNHASNYLSIRARLPEEKERVIKMIRSIMDAGDLDRIRPEYLRGL